MKTRRFKKMTYLNIIGNYNVKSQDTVADLELGKSWDNLFQETALKSKLERKELVLSNIKRLFSTTCFMYNEKYFYYYL